MYLTEMGVKGVTIESMRGRGEVEVQAEGESQRVELTEGGEAVRKREMKE